MNERLYKGKPIPLRMLVGASNELPEEEILAAVYDRFLLRDVVEYVQADATWTQLMTLPPVYTPTAMITVQEWDAARNDVENVPLPDRVVQELLRVRNELKANGVVASDRRWIALTRALRAAGVALEQVQQLRLGGLYPLPQLRRPAVSSSAEAKMTALDAYHDPEPVQLFQ
jgi:MoxR-like ATPase